MPAKPPPERFCRCDMPEPGSRPSDFARYRGKPAPPQSPPPPPPCGDWRSKRPRSLWSRLTSAWSAFWEAEQAAFAAKLESYGEAARDRETYTIEIRGDTSQVQAALKEMSADLDAFERRMAALRKPSKPT